MPSASSSEPSSEESGPPSGWYPDPSGRGHRWWDGSGWTDSWQGDGDEPQAALSVGYASNLVSLTSPSKAGTIVGLAGGLVLFFSTFSKWMTVTDGAAYNAFDRGLPWLLTGASYDPFERGALAHGFVLALVAVAVLVLVVRASRRMGENAPQILLGLGALVVVLAIANALAFRSAFEPLAGVGIGIGLWISLLAGLAIAASGGLLSGGR